MDLATHSTTLAVDVTEESSPFEFVTTYLRANPKAGFGEVLAAASNAGLTLYPITFARARAAEGLPPGGNPPQDRRHRRTEPELPVADALRDLQQFIDRPRTGWVLTPVESGRRLAPESSKMGGEPYPGDLEAWPVCPICDSHLRFALQIARREFPGMWFPTGSDLFQIFRCGNEECRSEDELRLDVITRSVFTSIRTGPHPRALQRENRNPVSVEFMWNAQEIEDYPSGREGREAWWGGAWKQFQDKYDVFAGDPEALLDSCMKGDMGWFYRADFWSRIENTGGIKIAGLPSWLQSGDQPSCRCGQQKEFIFQFISIDQPSLRIPIVGSGNLYYFVCKQCGADSLETRWDCD